MKRKGNIDFETGIRGQFTTLMQIAMLMVKDHQNNDEECFQANIQDLVDLMDRTEPNLVAHAKKNISDLVNYNFNFLK